jgi:hypothetical protein
MAKTGTEDKPFLRHRARPTLAEQTTETIRVDQTTRSAAHRPIEAGKVEITRPKPGIISRVSRLNQWQRHRDGHIRRIRAPRINDTTRHRRKEIQSHPEIKPIGVLSATTQLSRLRQTTIRRKSTKDLARFPLIMKRFVNIYDTW